MAQQNYSPLRRNYLGGNFDNCRHLSAEELENNIGGLAVTNEKLRETFDALDTNRNGFLEFNEVKKYYEKQENFGLMWTDKQIEADLRKYTSRPDGKVTFEEFCCIVLHLAQR
jgi:Ca2+-binding EF-hand superfamily protein